MKGRCRITGERLTFCFDLGNQYVTGFSKKSNLHKYERSPLKVGMGKKSKLLQLYESYPPEKMYREYWYKSGINETMVNELKGIVRSAKDYVKLNEGDTVLDIASNDGTLLKNYENSVKKIGIDPCNIAKNSKFYQNKNVKFSNNFFTKKNYLSLTKKKSKIITAIAMFYDLENPIKFLKDVKSILSKDGIGIIQIGYTPLMFASNEFGFISHEHICYYTLKNISDLLKNTGLEIFNVITNDINGGSIRVYFCHKNSKKLLKCPLNLLDIGQLNLQSFLNYEKILKLDKISTYVKFTKKIDGLKAKTIKWLKEQKKKKKLVIGYGASTKGNVLLQYYNITSELLPYIADRMPAKHGLVTVGTNIPIISENEMRKMKPDYLLALPWFFIKSFEEREKKLLNQGTKFVLPLPDLKIR
jgi:NDP-4-keto-2,6-dideoxyhexose 3-C-methyltransferase